MATQVYAACIVRTLERYNISDYLLDNANRYVRLSNPEDFNTLKQQLNVKKSETKAVDHCLVLLMRYMSWTFESRVERK